MVKSKLSKSSKKNLALEELSKIDLNLITIKKNGLIFNKKKGTSSESSTSQSKSTSQPQPTSQSKSIDSTGKTPFSKKEGPVSKSDNAKTKIIERDGSLEENVDFSVSFEPTKVSSPIIQERKEKPVKDMEQFLEQVPTPRKEEREKAIIYEPIDENYLRSYESTYQGRKWDEDRVIHEIKENLQRFEHPGHFREIMPFQDPTMTKNTFSEQVKYDLEQIDRIDNEKSIFHTAFEKKYKSRGKL